MRGKISMNLFHFAHVKPVKNPRTSMPEYFLLGAEFHSSTSREISQHSKQRALILYEEESPLKQAWQYLLGITICSIMNLLRSK